MDLFTIIGLIILVAALIDLICLINKRKEPQKRTSKYDVSHTSSGGSHRCSCGGSLVHKQGWSGSWNECDSCGRTYNISRSHELRKKIDAGEYKKK